MFGILQLPNIVKLVLLKQKYGFLNIFKGFSRIWTIFNFLKNYLRKTAVYHCRVFPLPLRPFLPYTTYWSTTWRLGPLNSLWAVVNLNSNRTCPVCTGLPDNSVYWPDPMVQYVALGLTRLTYDRGQFSWHSLVAGLTVSKLHDHYL